jgi:hypothetical protein
MKKEPENALDVIIESIAITAVLVAYLLLMAL